MVNGALLFCMKTFHVEPSGVAVERGLVQIAPGLWSVCVEAVVGGPPLPLRMTVIALSNGDIALHSPIPLSQEMAATIAAQGPVKHVIAPSGLHHLYVQSALKHFPEARTYASPAVIKKRPDLRVDEALGHELPPVLSEVLAALPIEGSALHEIVFFHKPSGSLLVTDLIFNITQPQRWMTNFLLRCTGTYGKLAQSRLWKFYAKDKVAFARSNARMLQWDFDRLVPCHGEVFENGAKQAVRQILRWQ